MASERYLNQWYCQLCGWRTRRQARQPAAQLAHDGCVLITCTRPHDVGTDPCKGLMLLVGFVRELGEGDDAPGKED